MRRFALARDVKKLVILVAVIVAIGALGVDWARGEGQRGEARREAFDAFVRDYGQELKLNEARRGRFRVMYQEKLSDKREEIEAWLVKVDERDRGDRVEAAVLAKDLDQITAMIDGLVGGHHAETVAKSSSADFLKKLLGVNGTLSFVEGEVVFAIVDRNDVFKYVQKGGAVPGVSIDPETGRGKVEVSFKVGSETGQQVIDGVEMVVPVETGGGVRQGERKDLVDAFEGLTLLLFGGEEEDRGIGRGVAIHEIAELAIIRRLNAQPLHSRWFTDGMAEVVTWLVLRDVYGEEMAQQWERDTELFGDMLSEVDLLRWEKKGAQIETKIETISRLGQARYAFAGEEFRRLVDVYGEDVIKQIIGNAVEMGEQRQATDTSLVAAVEDVDPGFGERMKRYMKYEGGQEAMIKGYWAELLEARKDERWDEAVAAFMHLKEQRDEVVLDDYAKLAELMRNGGRGQEAEQGMLKLLKGVKGEKNKANVGRILIRFYLQNNENGKAAELSDLVLTVYPDDEVALLGRVLKMMRLNKYNQAILTAERLKRVAKPDSRAYEIAESAEIWIHENVGLVNQR
ncbi:tetratricopeptide repeat protein [Poriferisphaera corsica]|nr:hypothetical protein [Poriferisphaera corsica]